MAPMADEKKLLCVRERAMYERESWRRKDGEEALGRCRRTGLGALGLGRRASRRQGPRGEDGGAPVGPGDSARMMGRSCGELEADLLGTDLIQQLQAADVTRKAMELRSGGGGQIHGGDGASPVKTTGEGGYTKRQGKKENGRRSRREGRRGTGQLRRELAW